MTSRSLGPNTDGRRHNHRSTPERGQTPFDEPALWRADIIIGFRLRGEERCAAASPAPGFPQVLRSVLSVLDDVPPGPWVDAGGGLGGVASWLQRTLGVEPIVLDAELLSLRAARRLFPTLRLATADAAAAPVRSASVAVVILSGIVSLLDELDAVLDEAHRILMPGGVVIVTDLWSSNRTTRRRDPNTFWSIEDLTAVAERCGLTQIHVAVADTSTGWWSGASQQVSDEIDRRYADDPAYPQWRADQDHLIDVTESGIVMPAGVVFRADRRS